MPRLTRREVAGSLFLILLAGAAAVPAQPLQRERPNVLLILTDDQGWGDLSSHGNPLIDTPHMDRIAAQGARFDRFYVSPVCAPTRASLLTGRWYLRTGVHGVTRGEETMQARETTLAELLKANGYKTGIFGKWHNGAYYPYHPNGQGFDEFVGFCGGHWSNYFDTELEHNGKPIPTRGYITDVLTEHAVRFIETHRDAPFFCYVPYNAPHKPWQVPNRFFDKYKARGLDDTLATSYGMTESVDENIGRLLARLDDLEISDRTIVLFATDNGPNTDRYNGGMRGRKGSVHEGGVRVPLFVRYPGVIQPGTVIGDLADHVDILPTILELCGLAIPDNLQLDGRSLAGYLRGEKSGPERMLFSYWAGGRIIPGRGAVRTNRWRAVGDGSGRWTLYDMRADPAQENDVSAGNPETVRSLKLAFSEWFGDVTRGGFDPVPIPVGHGEMPILTLPAHEARLHPDNGAGIRYHGEAGWAHDWIDGWTDAAAHASWSIEVARPGRYRFTLLYRAAPQSAGQRLDIEVGGQSKSVTIEKPYDPEQIPSPDRVRRNEVYEYPWAELPIGTIDLKPGLTTLRLRAPHLSGTEVAKIKGIRVQVGQ